MKKVLLALIIVFTVMVAHGQTNAQFIAGGHNHSLFVCKDSTAWSCGGNFSGDLGNGCSSGNTSSPLIINSLTGIISVGAGDDHSVFLKSDGTAWACGQNQNGQLGDGNTDTTCLLVQVNITAISAISICANESVFLKNDSTVWACGPIFDTIPIQVNGLPKIVAVSAGDDFSLFLESNGTVWSFGLNSYGQLGDGTTIFKSTPVQIPSLSGIIAIAAGGEHSLFLKSNGTVWACGLNSSGQLGDGTTISKLTPVQISSLLGIISIAAGGEHSLFLKNNGTVWACGYNLDGELGDGTTVNKSIPVQINSLSNILSIAAGGSSYQSFFVKNNGTVWACGLADNGQLGIGIQNNSPHPSPTQVTIPCSVSSTQEYLGENSISIYPNPFSTQATLQTDIPLHNATLTIYNSFGQEVTQSVIPSGARNLTITRDGLPSGIYFYKVTEDKGQGASEVIATGKLIITDK
ncbi:MAG: T9SS type A sorting domain-containing protein [Bacteroidetes bacterium]|nr:T9SS type A sorting domain-containing protein [Bacteroidota bacterium]